MEGKAGKAVVTAFGRHRQEDQEFKARFSWAPCQTKQNIINRGQHIKVSYSVDEGRTVHIKFKRSWFSPPTIWVLGIDSESSGLMPSSSFPTETSHQPLLCATMLGEKKNIFDTV